MRALVAALVLLASSPAWAGLTHYWIWKKPPAPERLAATAADMRKLLRARRDLVTLERTTRDQPIRFNGAVDGGCEDFIFPGDTDIARPKRFDEDIAAFNFTKTMWRKYDVVVRAALLVARAHFTPAELRISSDEPDDDSWRDARALYRRVFRRDPPRIDFAD